MNDMTQSLAKTAQAREFLAFRLGEEEYAIDIQKVQELRGYDKPTRIANAPDYVKGVINLRGVLVPIVDMRLKFKLAQAAYDQFTVVVVLNIGTRVVGMVVDSVSDVVVLNDEHIKAPPATGNTMSIDYWVGMGVLDERMLILVDIDKLMAGSDLSTDSLLDTPAAELAAA